MTSTTMTTKASATTGTHRARYQERLAGGTAAKLPRGWARAGRKRAGSREAFLRPTPAWRALRVFQYLGCPHYRNGARSGTAGATDPRGSQTTGCNVDIGRK